MQELEEDFFTFLQHRAIGEEDIADNSTSIELREAQILPLPQSLIFPPSFSSAVLQTAAPILSDAHMLISLKSSESWQSLGLAPSLFLQPRFSPQTPPPTPPCPNTNPQSTDELSMEVDKMELSCLQEPPQPMEVDYTDLPPTYQPTSMEVYVEDLPSSSDLPHPAPIHVENNHILEDTSFSSRETSQAALDNYNEVATYKSLAEALNEASGSNEIAKRKGRKTRMGKKKKADIDLREVSNLILFRAVF